MLNFGGLALPLLAVLVISYLLGSISFSIIFTKIYKKDDIRKYGSGNAGATNVLRSVGRGAAALTFLFDFLKCVLSVVLGRMIFVMVGAPAEISGLAVYGAGLACILGHMFPVFFAFRGGKGVVTTAAMIALVDWRVFLVVFAVFLLAFALRKIVSLASIVGMAVYPVVTFFVTFFFDFQGSPLQSHGDGPLYYLISVTVMAAVVGAVVVIKHKENIKRLVNGTEKPISFKKP